MFEISAPPMLGRSRSLLLVVDERRRLSLLSSTIAKCWANRPTVAWSLAPPCPAASAAA
jgi:hypothetical protein